MLILGKLSYVWSLHVVLGVTDVEFGKLNIYDHIRPISLRKFPSCFLGRGEVCYLGPYSVEAAMSSL